MNGELAQMIALVSHARAALAGAAFSLDLSNSTFKFVGKLDFERERRRFLRTPVYQSIGTTPAAWYDHLVGSGGRAIALVVERSSATLSEHVATACANGGSWSVSVTADGRTNCWAARWLAGDPTASDQRVWSVLYRELPSSAPTMPHETIGAASASLAAVLRDAHDFALLAEVGFWGEWFKAAESKLESDLPTFEYHPDMLPPSLYGLPARQLLAACERAWVFGGMGSWNDLGFEAPELQQRYETVTPALYRAVLAGICAAVNEPLPQ